MIFISVHLSLGYFEIQDEDEERGCYTDKLVPPVDFTNRAVK